MRRSRSKKGTILSVAIIFLLLSLAMIAVITWLLYFHAREDGDIGVNGTTGEVQIDIVDREQNSLVGDVLDFVTQSASGEAYFEPGAIYYTQGFQVKNVGDIPVDFRIYISEDENVDKKKFEEAFELYVTKDPANTDNAEKLTSFAGSLAVKENSDTYYLVVKMKETAGNEFQGKTYTGIGVTVYAVESKSENE